VCAPQRRDLTFNAPADRSSTFFHAPLSAYLFVPASGCKRIAIDGKRGLSDAKTQRMSNLGLQARAEARPTGTRGSLPETGL
jgi:hypothetical protein